MSTEPAPAIDLDLVGVLERARELGFLGDRPILEVVEHARAFCRSLAGVQGDVLDLGSGGGVPGLVIAHDRPDLHMTLLDRRTKRTDALERFVRRLGWVDRVEVVAEDADAFLRRRGGEFDSAVARGFGPGDTTLEFGRRAVRPGGLIVISEPPQGTPSRWPDALLGRLEVDRVPSESSVAVFQRSMRPSDH